MPTRRPLSVSTDKIAVIAMRCAHLLSRWAADGERIDRTGTGNFVEVYPAGALARWGLRVGLKKPPLPEMVAGIAQTLPNLVFDRELCETNDDALVAALVGRAAVLGLTDGPPDSLREQAAEEGWIHLPPLGSLAK